MEEDQEIKPGLDSALPPFSYGFLSTKRRWQWVWMFSKCELSFLHRKFIEKKVWSPCSLLQTCHIQRRWASPHFFGSPHQFCLFTAWSHAHPTPRTAHTFGGTPSLTSFSAASTTAVPESLFSLWAYKTQHTPSHRLEQHCSIYIPSKEPQKHPSPYGHALLVTHQHWHPGEDCTANKCPPQVPLGYSACCGCTELVSDQKREHFLQSSCRNVFLMGKLQKYSPPDIEVGFSKG